MQNRTSTFVKMSNIIDEIEILAPLNLADSNDNVGLLVGRKDEFVSKILIALDALDEVIDEAVSIGANAIITHHPIIRDSLNRINDDTPLGRRLLRLIENKISLYSAHTNLDQTEGGINDILFDIFDLRNKEFICEGKPGVFAGRAGLLCEEMPLVDFARFVKEKLDLHSAIYCGESSAKVHKVGVIGGGSANLSFFEKAVTAGCDTYVTSDIKLSNARVALDIGLNLVDATHYGSEVIFATHLKNYLQSKFNNLEIFVSKINGQPFKKA